MLKKIPEPASFRQLLNQLKDVRAGVVCRIQPENTLDMVPLAAFLLEYPVAYVVRNPASILSNISLHVYECTFILEQERLVTRPDRFHRAETHSSQPTSNQILRSRRM